MISDEPLPLSIPGQAIVSRAPTSPKHEFCTFYCSDCQDNTTLQGNYCSCSESLVNEIHFLIGFIMWMCGQWQIQDFLIGNRMSCLPPSDVGTFRQKHVSERKNWLWLVMLNDVGIFRQKCISKRKNWF